MEQAKIDELKIIHRDLAELLEKQHEFVLEVAPIVRAICQTLEGEASLGGKYKAHHQRLIKSSLDQTNREAVHVQQVLKRLKDW
jgi:hypothetical protein